MIYYRGARGAQCLLCVNVLIVRCMGAWLMRGPGSGILPALSWFLVASLIRTLPPH